MPKNLVPNHFDYAGIYVEGERSQFRFHKPVQASAMAGMLVPLGDPIPVFPGVKLDLAVDVTIRTATMVCPPLDPILVDFVAVWVPHRIIWNHFPQFLGENDTTAWTQTTQYYYPTVKLSLLNDQLYDNLQNAAQMDVTAANLFLSPHFGNFFGTSIGEKPAANFDINILAYRGYYAQWNYLFRDENYQRPVLIDKGDTGSAGEFGYLLRDYKVSSDLAIANDVLDVQLGDGLPIEQACLMPVNKLHDALTSVLPEPQFGDAVTLEMADTAPVIGSNSLHVVGSNGIRFGSSTSAYLPVGSILATNTSQSLGYTSAGSTSTGASVNATNLVADLSQATAVTINQLRTSVMYQRYIEALARGGRRTPEYYDVIYKVKNSVAAKDYPVLLHRSRYYLGVNQVVATADSSGDDWTSHLGDTGAYSLTNLKNVPICEQDFTEFGYLHIDYCFRSPNRYSQIIQPHFLKKALLDEYNPFFDHIGDVAVPGPTVNVLADTNHNFGYQEAWWDERTQLSMSIGAVNKLYGSLKYWVIGEVFDGTVTTCTPTYLTFDPAVYNDLFVTPYYGYPQFIIDALIHGKKVARMSPHSIPGITGRI